MNVLKKIRKSARNESRQSNQKDECAQYRMEHKRHLPLTCIVRCSSIQQTVSLTNYLHFYYPTIRPGMQGEISGKYRLQHFLCLPPMRRTDCPTDQPGAADKKIVSDKSGHCQKNREQDRLAVHLKEGIRAVHKRAGIQQNQYSCVNDRPEQTPSGVCEL